MPPLLLLPLLGEILFPPGLVDEQVVQAAPGMQVSAAPGSAGSGVFADLAVRCPCHWGQRQDSVIKNGWEFFLMEKSPANF
jgi:hypothetical protein